MSEPMSEERLRELRDKARGKELSVTEIGLRYSLLEAVDEIDRLRPIAEEAATLRAEKEALQRELIEAQGVIEAARDLLHPVKYGPTDFWKREIPMGVSVVYTDALNRLRNTLGGAS